MSKAKAPAEHVRLDVRNEQVARVYAEALYNTAQKTGKADAALEQLGALVDDVFAADPLLEKFLASRAIRREVKRSAIDRAFGNQADPMLVDFLQVLNNHDRLGLLRTIVQQYRDLNDERTRHMRVKVRAAAALSPQQEERLKAELKATYNMEPVLYIKVDPELLGGMVVQVGDWLYDSTVKTRLERLRNQLMAGSYHVQDGRDQLSSAT